MKILVINSGSSSIKFKVFDMDKRLPLVSGLVDRIGQSTPQIIYEPAGAPKLEINFPASDHQKGLEKIVEFLIDSKVGVIKEVSEIQAVGHRVVHGGEKFNCPTLITDKVLEAIEETIPLAPIHNPANLEGIKQAIKFFPKAHQVAIFDTAFHQTMPDYAFRYALPNDLYEKEKIRKYGFHGTSHFFITKEAASFLKIPQNKINLISIHLGNGCSMAAVKNGKSVDTTMGLTPLEGLIMGTRCGDIDPSIPYFLHTTKGLDLKEIDNLFNKQSGLLGLCGSNDLRDIEQMKDKKAELAIEMYCYRIKKYIGAYFACLGTLDAIIFTGGVGENASFIREKVLKDLQSLGIQLDLKKNANSLQGEIQGPASLVKILIIPTNEELEIANQTLDMLQNLS